MIRYVRWQLNLSLSVCPASKFPPHDQSFWPDQCCVSVIAFLSLAETCRCVGALGIHILQPTTVFAGLALCFLIYNSLVRPSSLQGSQTVLKHDPHEETMLLHRLSSGIRTVGSAAAVALPPFVALSSRHLSAPRGPPKFYLAVCLWLVMLVGELKLLFQTSLALVVWIGLFTLPRLYVENKWLLDGLARAGFAVLIAALRRRHRATLLMAVAGGLTVFWALEITLVVRCTMAMAISGATLFWRVSKCNAK